MKIIACVFIIPMKRWHFLDEYKIKRIDRQGDMYLVPAIEIKDEYGTITTVDASQCIVSETEDDNG